jgi:hypothetical protein
VLNSWVCEVCQMYVVLLVYWPFAYSRFDSRIWHSYNSFIRVIPLATDEMARGLSIETEITTHWNLIFLYSVDSKIKPCKISDDNYKSNRQLTRCYIIKILTEFGENICYFHWALNERGTLLSTLKGNKYG